MKESSYTYSTRLTAGQVVMNLNPRCCGDLFSFFDTTSQVDQDKNESKKWMPRPLVFYWSHRPSQGFSSIKNMALSPYTQSRGKSYFSFYIIEQILWDKLNNTHLAKENGHLLFTWYKRYCRQIKQYTLRCVKWIFTFSPIEEML